MPPKQIFYHPAVIDFSKKKLEVTVTAPTHGGDPLGSILGPMGSHWVQKMGQNYKKLPCTKIRIFDYPAVIDFLQKMEVTVMAPNHGGSPLGPILGPMGSHWLQKMGQNEKNHHAPQKKDVTVMGPNHSSDSLGSILGRMGSHWVQKMGQNRQKLPSHKIRIFDYPAVINFSQKMEVMFMAQNHGWDSLGSIFGPMGSHWVQKFDQNGKKLLCPKIRIFDYPAVIDFSQKIEVTVKASNHGEDSLGSILGPMGSHWVQKMGQNCENLPCPKNEFSTTRLSSIFLKKIRSYSYGAHSRWRPSRVHLGANGVPLGKKMGQNYKKLPCPKFEYLTTPRSSIFHKKWKLRLWRQISVGTPQGPFWDQWGPIGYKNGSKPLEITMPQNSNFRLPSSHRFFATNRSNGYGAKSRLAPSRVHLGANGVPLGPKNGSKIIKNYHAPKFEF